ncbi:MAG: hypothetical protein M2R45_02445 [Verrucomicrobia subdivision 3 bacterium]|nr:hypothetical protein [Limisphaerales bacterium]MCS1416350.1 hypothetical protein [Limisphaerales bacterium]
MLRLRNGFKTDASDPGEARVKIEGVGVFIWEGGHQDILGIPFQIRMIFGRASNGLKSRSISQIRLLLPRHPICLVAAAGFTGWFDQVFVR